MTEFMRTMDGAGEPASAEFLALTIVFRRFMVLLAEARGVSAEREFREMAEACAEHWETAHIPSEGGEDFRTAVMQRMAFILQRK